MKRRLKLLVGTFAFLLAAYWMYSYFSDAAPAKRPVIVRDSSTPASGGAPVGPGVIINPGKRPEIYSYDKNHRLEARYSADRWELHDSPGGIEKLDNVNSWQRGVKLIKPNIQWYLKTGEVVILTAELGSMRANNVAGQLRIEEGQLNDNVVITLDRGRDVQRKPLAERPEDAVVIKVEDIRFDNQHLSIQSNSKVVVTSRESDIVGTGLHMDWSEGPRELGELRIDQGESMLIREGGSLVDVSLPGSRTPVGGKDPTVGASGASGAATPAPAAPVTPAEARTVSGQDLYVATFTNSVNVDGGPRRYLRGADEMRVVFEYKASKSLREGRLGQGPTPTSGKAAKTPPVTPVTPITPITPIGSSSAGRPTVAKPAPSTQPAQSILITWKGPLVIKPLREPQPRLPKQVDFAAKGNRMELGDSQGAAVCRSFTFTSPGQEGQLVGTYENPVELTMAGGEKVVAPQVDFLRATQERPGKINMLGAGTMSMPASTAGAASGAAGAGAVGGLGDSGFAFGAGTRQDVKIGWSKSVAAVLGIQTGEASNRRRDFVRKADFVGGVVVQQGTNQRMSADILNVQFYSPETPNAPVNRIAQVDASGNVDVSDSVNSDFVKCQTLQVKMALGKDDKSAPQTIFAKGAVAARQQKTEINSDDLTILMGPQVNDKTGKVENKPLRLLANGRVKVIDNSGTDPVFASADNIDSNIVTRQATLRGTKDEPARVRQKDNDLEGGQIVLDQNKQAADVIGAGRLRVVTNSDLSGNKVAQPRPVDIHWTDKMLYRGLDRQAEIVGKVQLDTAEDRINCQTMHILFAAPDPLAKLVATRAASKPARGVDMQFNPQKIEMVIADKAVEMLSTHKDAEGFLLRGMWLKSDQLVYQAASQQVQCNTPGVMLVEDYRAPAQGKPAAGDDMGIDTSHPAQTVFEWSKSMELQQGPRAAGQPAGQAGGSMVRIVGDAVAGKPARIKHNSGGNIVLADKLPVRPWGKLPAGRTTDITCDILTAEFAPAPPDPKLDPKAAPKAEPDSGPRVGPLDSFDAKGHVNLLDGPRQVLCQRIAYTRKSDTAVLYGSLPDDKPKNVVIYFQDPQKGQVQSMAPTFVWSRADNHIEAKDIEAVGGR